MRALLLCTLSTSRQDPPLECRMPLRPLGSGGSPSTEKTPPTGPFMATLHSKRDATLSAMITFKCANSPVLHHPRCYFPPCQQQNRVPTRVLETGVSKWKASQCIPILRDWATVEDMIPGSRQVSWLCFVSPLCVGEFTDNPQLHPAVTALAPI